MKSQRQNSAWNNGYYAQNNKGYFYGHKQNNGTYILKDEFRHETYLVKKLTGKILCVTFVLHPVVVLLAWLLRGRWWKSVCADEI